MKNIKRIALMTLGFATIWVAGCKKENKTTENSIATAQTCTSCAEGEELALKIKGFSNSLEQAKKGAKNGEVISLEEAIENMELLINASHGFPFEDYGQRANETIEFQLEPDAEGKVSMAAVAAAYDEMKALVRAAYQKNKFESKGLIVVTLKTKDESKGGGSVEADITIGDKDKSNPLDECWYYGEGIGNCAQTIFNTDAADQLHPIIAENNPILNYDDCPGSNYRIILQNQPEVRRDGFEYTDENGEYLMFYIPDFEGNGFTNEEMQLESEEMHHYYNNELELIYNIIPGPNDENYPFPDYVLVNCYLNGNDFENADGIICIRHEHSLTYARRYWVETGVIPDPTPINDN